MATFELIELLLSGSADDAHLGAAVAGLLLAVSGPDPRRTSDVAEHPDRAGGNNRG